jgi:hypothetical protein
MVLLSQEYKVLQQSSASHGCPDHHLVSKQSLRTARTAILLDGEERDSLVTQPHTCVHAHTFTRGGRLVPATYSGNQPPLRGVYEASTRPASSRTVSPFPVHKHRRLRHRPLAASRAYCSCPCERL